MLVNGEEFIRIGRFLFLFHLFSYLSQAVMSDHSEITALFGTNLRYSRGLHHPGAGQDTVSFVKLLDSRLRRNDEVEIMTVRTET
jgi:hypothetical protein